MYKFRHLATLGTLGFLILGLTGCGKDNQNNQITGPAWGVGEEVLLRKGYDHVSLENAERKFKNYEISDEIYFPKIKNLNIKDIRLQITTTCFHDNMKLGQHRFSEPMKSSYTFFELLPKEAIFNNFATPENPVKCSVEFLASNPNGDTHRFNLESSPIIVNELSEYVQIFRSKTIVMREKNKIPKINISELPLYTLPQLSNKSLKYDLECSSMSARLPATESSIRLDQFDFKPHDTEEQSALKRANELCRIFITNDQNKIENISDTFILNREIIKPVVTPISSVSTVSEIDAPLRLGFTIGKYILSNPTDHPIILGQNTYLDATLQATLTVSESRKIFGIHTTFPIQMNVLGANVFNVAGQNRFVIPAHQSATVTFAITNKSIICRSGTLFGMYYKMSNPLGLSIDILDSEQAPLDSLHVLSTLVLETPFERFLYIRIPNYQSGNYIPYPNENTPLNRNSKNRILPDPPAINQIINGQCSIR